MPNNLTLRLSTAGQVFISKNRKVGRPWRWSRIAVTVVVLATAGVFFTSLFLAWGDLQYLTQSYQISQAQEVQKQYLDLNRKLRIELACLTSIHRLEQLAAQYDMGAPDALPGRESAVNLAVGKWVRLRIGLVALALVAFGLWISGRFFYLQVIRGPELREEATREYQKFCPILPVRGMVLDRNGTELAVSTRISSVVAHPSQIRNAARLSRELAPILGINVRELQEMLTRARPFVFVKRQLTPEREEAFRAWGAAEEARSGRPGSPAAPTWTPFTWFPRPSATILNWPWRDRCWVSATSTARGWKDWNFSMNNSSTANPSSAGI